MDFVFYKQRDKKLWLHNNGYKYGHTKIKYFDTLLPGTVYTTETTGPDVEITNLYDGSWCFYLDKPDAVRQTIDFTEQTNQEFVTAIRTALDLTDALYTPVFLKYRDDLNDTPELSDPAVLYQHMDAYEKLVSSSHRETTHKALLYTLELLQLRQNQQADGIEAYNAVRFVSDRIQPYLTGTFSGYLQIQQDTKTLRRQYLSLAQDSFPLALSPGLYTLSLRDTDQNILKTYAVYIHTPEDLQQYYYRYILDLQTEGRQIQQFLTDGGALPDFSDAEKELYAKQLLYTPDNLVLPPPQVAEDIYGILTVTVRYDLIQNMPAPVFLVAEEADTLNVTDNHLVKRRFPVTADRLEISRKTHYFNLEPYFWYLETEDHIKVSAVVVFDVSEEDTEYPQKANHQLLVTRAKRLSPQLSYDLEQPQDVMLTADEVTYDTDVTLWDFADHVFERYLAQPHSQDRWNALKSLYTDQAFHEERLPGLTIRVRPQWNRVETPAAEQSPYVVKTVKWDIHGVRQEFYGSQSDTRASFFYTDCLYCLIRMYDIKTGNPYGGWLAFDNTKDRLTYDSYQMDVIIDRE